MNPSIDWEPVREAFYRKQKLYQMNWGEMDLKKYLCAAAPFGGPIALIRNDKRIVALQHSSKPMMHIYTSAGVLLNQFQWDRPPIVAMGWIKRERLACVLEQGSVYIFDLDGGTTQVSLGEEAKESEILEAIVYNEGVVVLTKKYQFITIQNINEPRVRKLADLKLTSRPDCWDILTPEQSINQHLEVFVVAKKSIWIIDQVNAQDQMIQRGPFQKMCISPNGKFLALFTFDARVWVVSTNFQDKLTDFKTNSEIPPTQMTWCGNDAVVLHWDDTILMVGPMGDYLKFIYDGVVHMVSEVDSVRIVSHDKCEILEKVPNANVDVFRIGSTASSAILYDARELFDRKNPKADEHIRSIGVFLTQAVDGCIEAAGNELDVGLQKSLLKAASFGKAFLEFYPASKLVDMNKAIRVLNSIRQTNIGIPLTYQQFRTLTSERLVDILVNRRHFGLAKKICEYLNISCERVLIQWACHQVKQSVEDDEFVSRAIFDKLSETAGVSYYEVAKEAHNSGRTKLATRLLEFEASAADQVPLLLRMNQNELALKRAIESGDTDLVYLVIFHMKRELSIPDFFRIINGKPLACSLLEVYAKQQDPTLLRDFYYQDDRRISNANLILSASYKEKVLEARLVELKAALKLFKENPETAGEAKATDELIKLLQTQSTLERDLNHTFMELSLYDTVLKCLVLDHSAKAARLKSDFRISDKKYSMLVLRAIVDTLRWTELEAVMNSTT
ncbi:Vps16, N-terminal region-domain-containing protein [Globomyces pollinis-pini]|nr:Vps16, N-terminal region-domain-containing protein [Globomyces pollinis-pini]